VEATSLPCGGAFSFLWGELGWGCKLFSFFFFNFLFLSSFYFALFLAALDLNQELQNFMLIPLELFCQPFLFIVSNTRY
jgi:hypothetical protein